MVSWCELVKIHLLRMFPISTAIKTAAAPSGLETISGQVDRIPTTLKKRSIHEFSEPSAVTLSVLSSDQLRTGKQILQTA